VKDISSDLGSPSFGVLGVHPKVCLCRSHEYLVCVFESSGPDGVDPNEIVVWKEGAGFGSWTNEIGDNVAAVGAECLGLFGHAGGLALPAFGREVPVIGRLSDFIGIETLSVEEWCEGVGEGGFASTGKAHNKDYHGPVVSI